MAHIIILAVWFIIFSFVLFWDTLHSRELKGRIPEQDLKHQYEYEIGLILYKRIPRVPKIGYIISSFVFVFAVMFVPPLIVSSCEGTLINPENRVMGFLQDYAVYMGVIVSTITLYTYRKIMDYMPEAILSLVENKPNDKEDTRRNKLKCVENFASDLFQTKRTRGWLIVDLLSGLVMFALVFIAQYLKVGNPTIFLSDTEYITSWSGPEYLGGYTIAVFGWFVLVYFGRIVLAYVLKLAWAMLHFGKTLDQKNLLQVEPLHPDGAGGLVKYGKLTWRMALIILPALVFFVYYYFDRGANFIFYTSVVAILLLIPLIFFTPLWGVHKAMEDAKIREIKMLSNQFNANTEIMR